MRGKAVRQAENCLSPSCLHASRYFEAADLRSVAAAALCQLLLESPCNSAGSDDWVTEFGRQGRCPGATRRDTVQLSAKRPNGGPTAKSPRRAATPASCHGLVAATASTLTSNRAWSAAALQRDVEPGEPHLRWGRVCFCLQGKAGYRIGLNCSLGEFVCELPDA